MRRRAWRRSRRSPTTPRSAAIRTASRAATRFRLRRGRTGRRVPRGECRPQCRGSHHRRLLHVHPPRGAGRNRAVRRRDVRPRLWRRERFLPARRSTRLASSACLRHLRLPRRLGELRRRRVRRSAAGHGAAARALSPLRAPGGPARETRCRWPLPLRRHRRAVPPLETADHTDVGARPGRWRAAAYPGPCRAHRGTGELPAAGGHSAGRGALRSRACRASRAGDSRRSRVGPRDAADVGAA